MRFRLGVCLIVLSLAAVAFAGPDRPITSLKSLAGFKGVFDSGRSTCRP